MMTVYCPPIVIHSFDTHHHWRALVLSNSHSTRTLLSVINYVQPRRGCTVTTTQFHQLRTLDWKVA